MSVKFNQLVAKMPELLKTLESCSYLTRDNLVDIPNSGVYSFYESGKSIYIGRSNRMKQRLQEHGRPSSNHNTAPFAFNLAKEEFERGQGIPSEVTREELASDPRFRDLFFKAKDRVARMKIRVIGINDQVEQALFEIYAALSLNTKYNDFGTH